MIARDVTAAMLVERTMAKKTFDPIILQNLSYVFLLLLHQRGRLIT